MQQLAAESARRPWGRHGPEAAGAKDAKEKEKKEKKKKKNQGLVTWCARALKCTGPADVTIREFKSPKLGRSPVQSFRANPCAAVARRGSPRATGWDHTSPQGPQRGWRGAGPPARTPTAGGDLHRERDPSLGHAPRPRARIPTRLTRRNELPGQKPRAPPAPPQTHSPASK